MAGFRANVVRAYNDGVSTLSLNEQVTGNYTANLSVSVPNLGPSTYTNYLWNLKRADGPGSVSECQRNSAAIDVRLVCASLIPGVLSKVPSQSL